MTAMRHTLPDPLLSCLSEFLATQIGLHFPRERWGDLERGMASAAREFGIPVMEECIRWLLSAPLTHRQIEILASHLTIGETYFFRDQKCFEALEQQVLPALIRSRRDSGRRIRIWSAACCTGEEPYSIAMLLDRLLPDHEQWHVTLLATDINPQFLRKAEEGVYGEWSFRDTPAWIKERYFKRVRQGRFEIHPRIKNKVTFSYLNLVDDVYPSLSNNTNAMDVIFCRNVLMYFTTELAQKVAGNLHRAVADGGWLAVSPTEASNILFPRFSPVNFPGAMLYRKDTKDGAQFKDINYSNPAFATAPEILTSTAPVITAMPGERFPFLPLPETPRQDAVQPQADEKIVELLGALPRQQDEPGALRATARLRANQGKLAEAVEWCDKAIALDKLNPQSHYLLATIWQELAQPDAAEQSLKRVLYLVPNFTLAHFAMGNLHLSQGRRREAERYFANALALLQAHPRDGILPESEGLTSGRLAGIISSVMASLPRTAEVRA